MQITKIDFPPGESECAYFTFGEFAKLFEEKLHKAFVPFNVVTLRADEPVELEKCKSRISGSVRQLTDYKLSRWNWIKKWLLPFLGHKYRPASFAIVGILVASLAIASFIYGDG